MISGLQAGNWLDSAGTTAATVDNPVGLVVNALGGFNLTQATTANKLILRRGVVNLMPNSTMRGAVAGTPGTAPTGWSYSSPGGIQRSIVGSGSVGGVHYVDVRYYGTATLPGDVILDQTGPTVCQGVIGQTFTFATRLALVGGAWPSSRSVNLAIFERNNAGSSLAISSLDVRGSVTSSTPVEVKLTRTLVNATAAFVSAGLRHSLLVGESVDYTVRIMAPQLEVGTLANAFSPTNTAPASSNSGLFGWQSDGNGDLFQTNTTAANTGYVCVGAEFFAGRANYIWYAGAGTPSSPGAMLRVLTNGVVQCGVGDGSTRTTADSAAIAGHSARVYEGGWDAASVLVGVNGVITTRSRTQVVAGVISGQLGGSVDAGAALSILGTIYPAIIMSALPTAAERATLRRFIGSLSGVAL